MTSTDHWNLLRHGNTEQGLLQLKEAYALKPSASHIMELGAAYLWIGDYQAAWRHFQHALQTHHHTSSGFYGRAGVAKWCVGEPAAAVREWHTGLEAQLADTAGRGIHLPLLLFTASILRPGSFPRDEAEQILNEKTKDPRVKSWPGPIAEFVLGKSDERTLSDLCVEKTSFASQTRKWLFQFYKSVFELNRGGLSSTAFKELMRKMADTSQPECAEQEYFLSLLWREEFFIARYEASLN